MVRRYRLRHLLYIGQHPLVGSASFWPMPLYAPILLHQVAVYDSTAVCGEHEKEVDLKFIRLMMNNSRPGRLAIGH